MTLHHPLSLNDIEQTAYIIKCLLQADIPYIIRYILNAAEYWVCAWTERSNFVEYSSGSRHAARFPAILLGPLDGRSGQQLTAPSISEQCVWTTGQEISQLHPDFEGSVLWPPPPGDEQTYEEYEEGSQGETSRQEARADMVPVGSQQGEQIRIRRIRIKARSASQGWVNRPDLGNWSWFEIATRVGKPGSHNYRPALRAIKVFENYMYDRRQRDHEIDMYLDDKPDLEACAAWQYGSGITPTFEQRRCLDIARWIGACEHIGSEIGLFARAEFPGWENRVEFAAIEVYYMQKDLV